MALSRRKVQRRATIMVRPRRINIGPSDATVGGGTRVATCPRVAGTTVIQAPISPAIALPTTTTTAAAAIRRRFAKSLVKECPQETRMVVEASEMREGAPALGVGSQIVPEGPRASEREEPVRIA